MHMRVCKYSRIATYLFELISMNYDLKYEGCLGLIRKLNSE